MNHDNNGENQNEDFRIDKTVFPKDSFLEILLRYTEKATDTPDEFMIVSGLVGMAAAIENHVYFPFGGTPLRTNLWVIKIADSSYLRKTTSDNIITDLIRDVKPGLVAPNETTPEQFIVELCDQPALLVVFSEIGGTLLRMDKQSYMAGFKSMLTELYDSPRKYSRKLKGTKQSGPETYNVESPCISILSSTTLDWFQKACTEEDARSGFLPRFQFCTVRKRGKEKMVLPQKADEKIRDILIEHLQVLNEFWEGEKVFTKPAEEEYTKWCRDNEAITVKLNISLLGPFLDRLEKSIIKMAMIMQGMLNTTEYIANPAETKEFNNSPNINKEAMKIALHLGTFFRESIISIITKELSFDQGGKLEKRILNVLRDNGGKLTRRELTQKTAIYSRTLISLLASMENVGMIKQETIRTTGGQSSYVVNLIEENTENPETKDNM